MQNFFSSFPDLTWGRSKDPRHVPTDVTTANLFKMRNSMNKNEGDKLAFSLILAQFNPRIFR